jgi:uncharacterized protein
MNDPTAWITAVLAGLGGAAHCASMCGPLTLALGTGPLAGRSSSLTVAIGFNTGRVLAYTLAGALTFLVLGGAVHTVAIEGFALLFRLVAASLLGLIGVGLLGIPLLSRVEQAMTPVWSLARGLLGPVVRWAVLAPQPLRPLLFGLLWIVMPCGLVYSMLLVAATRDTLSEAVLVASAFAIGTLPAVLGLSLAGARIGQWLQRRPTRQMLGLLLVVAAVWSMSIAISHYRMARGGEHAHHHMTDTSRTAPDALPRPGRTPTLPTMG